jgi:hypothetical protein
MPLYVLGAFAVTLVPLGLWLFALAIEDGKRNGTLGQH